MTPDQSTQDDSNINESTGRSRKESEDERESEGASDRRPDENRGVAERSSPPSEVGVRGRCSQISGEVLQVPAGRGDGVANRAGARDPLSSTDLVIHELKCWPEYFDDIYDGRKTFEVRKNDRGFRSGHVLHLREWRPQIEGGYYTGRETHVRVLGVYPELPGVEDGHVVMSLGNGVRVPDETPQTASKQRAALGELIRAAAEVHRISDRTHDAWIALAAALDEARAAETKSHEPYLVRAFWSPCGRYLVSAHVTAEGIVAMQDDNGVEWKAAGEQTDVVAPELSKGHDDGGDQ